MVASIAMRSMRASKDNIDFYEAYGVMLIVTLLLLDCIDIDEFSIHEINDMVKKIGNDEDVRRISEYIRLGYKMTEVFIEHDKTIIFIEHDKKTVFTYIDAAYNTPKKNDANVIGKSSSRHEDEDDFDPFFGLDSEPIDATNAKNKYVDKGKGVALDDDQIHVQGDNTMLNETDDGNSDGDSSESSEHDELVDMDNELVEVEVDMDHFDRTNAKTMGNEGTPEFNVDEEFDIGKDVINTKEFQSASDEDGIERIRSRKIKQNKRQNKVKEGGLHKVNFCVGQEFPNSVVVKDLMHRHSIETKRELYLKKNDKVRVRVVCRGTILVFTNSCDIGPKDIIDQIKTNPKIPIKAIQEQLQRNFQLEVSRMKAFRAKEKAIYHVRESEADHMKPTRIFKRIYVCLGAAKEGFKACMRQFLGFDGTFMKGPFPGQLLTAVGVDPNNGIYPLAYGIVETELRES
ncbi:mutator type transposase [Tanacetum coccineum]